jgi:very-short-patch-repair endonuclease
MPPRRTTPQGYENARLLRKEPTRAERKLWAYLRGNKINNVNFRRQHAIGNFVPDFCAIKEKLVIELDGSQHLEQEKYDEDRTAYLESQGYTVIRFWNNQVMNDIEGVISAICHALELDKRGSHQ